MVYGQASVERLRLRPKYKSRLRQPCASYGQDREKRALEPRFGGNLGAFWAVFRACGTTWMAKRKKTAGQEVKPGGRGGGGIPRAPQRQARCLATGDSRRCRRSGHRAVSCLLRFHHGRLSYRFINSWRRAGAEPGAAPARNNSKNLTPSVSYGRDRPYSELRRCPGWPRARCAPDDRCK